MDDFWQQFRLDPRDPANGPLRAADADRVVVHSLLDEAYADGRLSREEHEQRAATTIGAVTLADLLPIVTDLVPATPTGAVARRPRATIEQRAEARFRADLRDTALGFVFFAVVLNAIWLFTGHGFYWPVFPMAVFAIRTINVALNKESIVEKERTRLERRQAAELEQRKQDEE